MAASFGVWKSRIVAALLYWVALPGAVITAGLVADAALAFERLRLGPAWRGFGGFLICAGTALIGRATRDLRVYGGGTPNPLEPPVRLVDRGSYAFCRHPMFLGYDIAALGVLLLVGSRGALLLSFPAFLLGQGWFLRQKEERSLERRFPGEYARYRSRVPFLVPWRLLRKGDA